MPFYVRGMPGFGSRTEEEDEEYQRLHQKLKELCNRPITKEHLTLEQVKKICKTRTHKKGFAWWNKYKKKNNL